MAIIGIETLVYGVDDFEGSVRFFEDFGLSVEDRTDEQVIFRLPEGSAIQIKREDDPSLPETTSVGAGVREVIWGVDTHQSLKKLADNLAADRTILQDADGTVHFITDFGIPMALRVFKKRPVICAPDPVNTPGRINRLNQHRRWRRRAYPKGLSHVVFAVPDYLTSVAFMRDRLEFRVSDDQRGFGIYLRADGSNHHHNFLLLNANAPLDGNDGQVRFHHANFAVEDLDEIMVGANYMERKGWEKSHLGLGRHRVDSALFYYLPCPAGGEAEYGADTDYLDDAWVPREWINPLFGYAQFVHNLPPFLMDDPSWEVRYMTPEEVSAKGRE